jgi:hypothetical protein
MSKKVCWSKAVSAVYSHRGNHSSYSHQQRRRRRKIQSIQRHAVRSAAYSTSSSTDTTNLTTDYWKDGGIIEGVWMFSRHGDRTPGRPLSPEHRRDEEAAFWLTKLPIPDSASVFEKFEKYFPVHRARPSEDFIDTPRNPFGFLTSKGLLQLGANGKRFFQRYNDHAYHFPGREKWRWESPHDFLSAWDIQVFSTNYLRTIMSVQSFLDGMFGTHCYDIQPMESDRLYDPSLAKEAKVPTVNKDRCTDADVLVKIKVRDTASDPLNAFDRNPDLIAGLVAEVMTTEDFVQRDGKAASLAARLANILPGLVRRKQGSDFSARAPSGINWVRKYNNKCRCVQKLMLLLTLFFDLPLLVLKYDILFIPRLKQRITLYVEHRTGWILLDLRISKMMKELYILCKLWNILHWPTCLGAFVNGINTKNCWL